MPALPQYALPVSAISALAMRDRYPLSSRYDPEWVVALEMGPHPLWQLEDILPAVALEPGSRVLDLGCGRGATSVFLARECGVTVTACDLWVGVDELERLFREAGVHGSVTAVNADVRRLPFEDDEFDAIVSIDAFEYFGTDVHLLPALLRVLKSGGRIGMTTPGLKPDPYEADVPDGVWSLWGYEVAAWHTPDWWRRHWQLSGLLDGIESAWLPDGRENWIRWTEAIQTVSEKDERAVLDLLESQAGAQMGFVSVTARKR
jgi:SAM-dependent methyltransferase